MVFVWFRYPTFHVVGGIRDINPRNTSSISLPSSTTAWSLLDMILHFAPFIFMSHFCTLRVAVWYFISAIQKWQTVRIPQCYIVLQLFGLSWGRARISFFFSRWGPMGPALKNRGPNQNPVARTCKCMQKVYKIWGPSGLPTSKTGGPFGKFGGQRPLGPRQFRALLGPTPTARSIFHIAFLHLVSKAALKSIKWQLVFCCLSNYLSNNKDGIDSSSTSSEVELTLSGSLFCFSSAFC